MFKKDVIEVTFVEVVFGAPRLQSVSKGKQKAEDLLKGPRMAAYLKTARLFKCNRFFTILRSTSIRGGIWMGINSSRGLKNK